MVKEARLSLDQADELSSLRRTLNRRRTDKSERLTDNTLIRIAVEVLLEHGDDLAGNTEEELAASYRDALGL